MVHEVKPLTGLRWLAALGVYLYHFGGPPWFPDFARNIAANGFIGVQFFFVLSGYVLTTRYYSSSFELGSYVRARLSRILPMYLCGLLLGVAYATTSIEPLDFNLLLTHGLGLQAWYGDLDKVVAFNGPGWTISVELLFYSVFPVAIVILKRSVLSTLQCLSIISFATIFGALLATNKFLQLKHLSTNTTKIPDAMLWYSGMPIYFLGLFVSGIGGSLLTTKLLDLPREHAVRRALQPNLVAITFLFALLAINIDSSEHIYFAILFRFSFAAVPVILLLSSLHIHPDSLVSKILGSKALSFLGRISYGFYIIHVPLIGILRILIPNLSYEIEFVLLLFVALLSYVVFEQPIRNKIYR